MAGQHTRHAVLRCHVLELLASVLELLGDERARNQRLAQALVLCKTLSGGSSAGVAATATAAASLPRLQLRIAEVAAASGEWQEACTLVAAAQGAYVNLGDTAGQGVAIMFGLQLDLAHDRESAGEAEAACDRKGGNFETRHKEARSWLIAHHHVLSAPLAARLALHCAALQALWLLRQGITSRLRDKPLSTGGSMASEASKDLLQDPSPQHLRHLLAEAQRCGAASENGCSGWPKGWLVEGEAVAVVALLCCCAWLPQSHIKEAAAAAQEGRSALVPLLADASVNAQAGEAALSLHSRAAVRLPLLLHCLLLQASAAAALTRCDFAVAGGHIAEMKVLVVAFPSLLQRHLQSACHTLCGTYASAVDQPASAIAHLLAAVDTAPDSATRRAAVIQAAAVEAATGGPTLVSAAISRLEAEGLYGVPPARMPNQHRTAAQLVAGSIQQTREAGGKLLLTRALKVAHSTMTNYQLVAQILAALGPLQAERDPAGSREMCSNSYVLSKGLDDLPSQIQAASATVACLRAAGEAPSPSQATRLQQKEAQLQARIAEAAALTDQHQSLLDL